MPSLKTSTRNGALSQIVTDAGTGAYLYFYTGSAPAKSSNNFVAPTGTLLSKHALANPIGTVATGVLTFSTIPTAVATNGGTPGYYRICSSSTDTDGSTCIVQGTAGVGSGEVNFTSAVVQNGNVTVSSFTISEGNA